MDNDKVSGAMALVTAALIGMGFLCAIEVFIMIGITFRRRTGLYFWSMIITNAAQLCVNISSMLKFWVLVDSCLWIPLTLDVASELCYSLFGFLILYSRLHILSASQRTLRFVLGVIVAEVLIVEITQEVLYAGSTLLPLSNFASTYNIWWRLEVCVYTACDLSLSGIYIFHANSMWSSAENQRQYSVLKHILFLMAFLILIDISNIVLTFTINSPVLVGIQGFLFAFKLKVEIWTLNQLTEMSRAALEASKTEFANSIG